MEPPWDENYALLKQRALRGFNWRFFAVVAQVLQSFVVSIILARLISPQAFGLYGMAAIFTGFAMHMTTLGMESAVIQRRDLTDSHLRTAMTLSLLMGLAVT